MKIFVIHENGVWVEPLRKAFSERGLPYEEWSLVEGAIDLDSMPPEGVFYNRMSASSFTRDHRYSPEMASVVLAWLERHGRRVLNDTRALRLEINKAAQYASLNAHGIATPRTVAVVGREAIVEAAGAFAPGPVILKPNRGGKGHGVRLFQTVEALRDHVRGDDFEAPIDGVSLLQEYVRAPEPFIIRAEFIGGRFFYAVRVDTSQGFELCPADACRVDGVTEPMFRIVDTIDRRLVKKYQAFLAANGIHIAGIEFIADGTGRILTYDVNTNTNYNPDAEAADGRSGMGEIARFLGKELIRQSRPRAELRRAG